VLVLLEGRRDELGADIRFSKIFLVHAPDLNGRCFIFGRQMSASVAPTWIALPK
jgi:hypothetical protein